MKRTMIIVAIVAIFTGCVGIIFQIEQSVVSTYARVREQERQSIDYAYDIGRRSAESGADAAGNPYQGLRYHTSEAISWNEGWIFGKQKLKESQK